MHSPTKPCRAALPPFPSPTSPQQKLLCPGQAARLSCEQLQRLHPHHAASSSQFCFHFPISKRVTSGQLLPLSSVGEAETLFALVKSP